jgi:hypothetical protein
MDQNNTAATDGNYHRLLKDRNRDIYTVSNLYQCFRRKKFHQSCTLFFLSLVDLQLYMYEFRISRKVIKRRHIRRDLIERFMYLRRVAYLHHTYLIDIDKTAASPERFRRKYGWASVGQPCIK